MYFKHKIFLLDPKQLKKISGATRSSVIFKMLEQIADAETTAPCSVKKSAHLHQNAHHAAQSTQKISAARYEERYITEDDCTNLRIELELCNDSLEFINRM